MSVPFDEADLHVALSMSSIYQDEANRLLEEGDMAGAIDAEISGWEEYSRSCRIATMLDPQHSEIYECLIQKVEQIISEMQFAGIVSDLDDA